MEKTFQNREYWQIWFVEGVIVQSLIVTKRTSQRPTQEGTGTRPDYLADQKNWGATREKNYTEIQKYKKERKMVAAKKFINSYWDVDYLPTRFRIILRNVLALSGLWGLGKDCRRDSGRAEQPDSWAWYKLSLKHQELGVVCQTRGRLSLFMAGAVAAFWGTMGRCCSFERRAVNYTFLRQWRVLDTHEIIARRSAGQPLFHDRWCRFDQPEIFIPKLLLRCGLLAWTRFRLILRNVLALSGL